MSYVLDALTVTGSALLLLFAEPIADHIRARKGQQ